MQEDLEAKNNYEIITLDEKEKWRYIVSSFSDSDVFYLPEYVEAFSLINNNVPILFYYNDGETKAINVFEKRDISAQKEFNNKIPVNKYFDITTPYGYGGFIIEGDGYKSVNKAFIEYCGNSNIISEFVRFSLFSNYINKYYGEVEKNKLNVIRKINMPPNEMLMDFEHKVRKNLKRANINNLEIELDTNMKTLDSFLEIYYNTMKRNNAKEEYYFPKEFFKKLGEINKNVVIFNVKYNKKIVSTELVIYSAKNCYSFLGGTLSDYFYLRPNDFLKYEIIKWAFEKNIENFVLGGGYTNSLDDGILKYKKSFAPNDDFTNFYIGKSIFDENIYNELTKIRCEENLNTSFFPIYRSMQEGST